MILIAVLAFYLLWPLSSGTEVGLGPGFVLKLFAIVQFAFGAIMVGHGFLRAGEPSEPWQLRPIVFILGSVAFFAVSIERLGLVIALTGLVLLACAANRETKFSEALALVVGSLVFSALVFVKALSLTIGLRHNLGGVN